MYGDDEHPISFVFEPRIEGAHIKVVVRSGLRGVRGYAGELTFRPEDWIVLRALLGESREVPEKLAAMMRYVPEGVDESSNPLRGVPIVYPDVTPIEIVEREHVE